MSSAVVAQRIVTVAPTEFGILNIVIDGDTTATGERVDPNTIYELERGPLAYYVLNGTIEHSGYHLQIVAEAGDGEKPKIVPGVITGQESVHCFKPAGDLTLKGLYITNRDQVGEAIKYLIRAQAEDMRIVIDDCHLDWDRQSHIRIDAHNQKLYLTNSIISNGIHNGRAIDRRGTQLDTMVVENCTFYNFVSRPFRWGGDGYANYIKINHNTLHTIGKEIIEIGETVNFIFTNNLIVNPGFFGADDNESYLFEDLAELTNPVLEGLIQEIEFRNNNIYLNPAILDLFPNLELSVANVTIVPRTFSDSLGLALMDTTTLTHEAIEFTQAPSLDTTLNIIEVVWEQFNGDEDYAPPFDNAGVGEYGESGFGTVLFDFSYPTSTQSYTAGDGGFPLGDLNWFPGKKQEWLSSGDDKKTAFIPNDFELAQNFPNPFNPTTTIQYKLPSTAYVHLTIYNLIGQEVVRLVDQKQVLGYHQVRWDGRDAFGNIVSSGVFFYQLNADDFTQIRKMILIK